MRLRVGLLLCLFGIVSVVGCRKPLAPNIDRNRAPETWITAAPFDTITVEKGGQVEIRTIPIRFHVYWAGSDRDGAVVGYYWAVVETLPLNPDGGSRPPPLPGPAPGDYRFTTRSDSTFIFNVAENIPDRQHTFYIYAVDDKGKADPTPARFIFNARDDDPPKPIFEEAYGRGRVYFFDTNRILQSEVRSFPIHEGGTSTAPPRDTVPSGSHLVFRFRADVSVPGTVVKGFRYKLDEPELQPVDPESLFHGSRIQYQAPPDSADPAFGGRDLVTVANGTKTFRLRAVDVADGSTDSTRRFQMNFAPDTWFAGPDPDVTGGPWQTNGLGEKFALLIDGKVPAGGLPGTLLNSDSVNILPVNRVPRRTFIEIYKDTVFIRREDDTVHLGSWVAVYNGGFDRDSPYTVKVAEGIPGFPGGVVLTPTGPNGSPIGFRSLITNFQTPAGPLSSTNQSRLYPFFDPNDPLNFPRIAFYHPETASGRAYSLQAAEDGDGGRDRRVQDAWRVVELPTPQTAPLRPLVLTYQVNFPPILRTDLAAFRPRATQVDTFTSRTWDLRLFNDDRDPYVSGAPVGGPSSIAPRRARFKITGLHQVVIDGRDTVVVMTTYEPPLLGPEDRYKTALDDLRLPVPQNLLTGPVTLNVELCDCDLCDRYPGTGRCINRDFQVYYVAQSPPASTTTPSRPGLD